MGSKGERMVGREGAGEMLRLAKRRGQGNEMQRQRQRGRQGRGGRGEGKENREVEEKVTGASGKGSRKRG